MGQSATGSATGALVRNNSPRTTPPSHDLRRIAQRTAREMPLDVVLHHRQAGQDDQVPDRRHHQQRNHLEVAPVDDLDRVEQLGQRQDVEVRRALGQPDDVVEGRRQDGAHRLRQHDAE
jgi:hypothetical protein